MLIWSRSYWSHKETEFLNDHFGPGRLHILGDSPYGGQDFYLELDGLFAHNLSAAELQRRAMESVSLPEE